MENLKKFCPINGYETGRFLGVYILNVKYYGHEN